MDVRSEFEYHQHHQFEYHQPAPVQQQQQQQQQLCMPMMEMDEQFLVPGRGAAGPGRGSAAAAERKRRFTEEQIRSLESMFHAHHVKLEPREKAELARELGLQPRQVAIWFQNKRARWRSKQLEHDFAALRAKYDALHSSVESLQQEKLTLTAQLHELSERLRERGAGSGGATATTASSSSCNGGGDQELLDVDDKRNVTVDVGCVDMAEPRESCVLGGTTCAATPADVSVESECDVDHHQLDYDVAGFPESFCATPELCAPWPLVEWNAVA